jgi:prophage antirepressor-like protein
MNQIVAFDFDSQAVRIIQDTNGEPWFVAADVCRVLEIAKPENAYARLDDDEKGTRTVGTPGGPQEMVAINEPGLYSLILTSRKPEAKRFKRWVTHEVLPTIRKTGSFVAHGATQALPAPTQDRVNAILMIGEAVAKMPGVKPGIAMAATLTVIQQNTGLAMEALRRALPAANEPIASLNPTQLGQLVGISARAVNQRLQSLGLQFRNERDEWTLTESGQAYAEALPFSRNGHSGYQILWRHDVIDMIKEVA